MSTVLSLTPSAEWLRAARRAKVLAWVSLAWMGAEGVIGIIAGLQAHSLGVVTWAASSFVEALASLIVVWRFTGHRALSSTSEARAQRWVRRASSCSRRTSWSRRSAS